MTDNLEVELIPGTTGPTSETPQTEPGGVATLIDPTTGRTTNAPLGNTADTPVTPVTPATPVEQAQLTHLVALSVKLRECALVAGTLMPDGELAGLLGQCNDMLRDLYVRPEMDRLVKDAPDVLARLLAGAAGATGNGTPGPSQKEPPPFAFGQHSSRIASESAGSGAQNTIGLNNETIQPGEGIPQVHSDHLQLLKEELKQ